MESPPEAEPHLVDASRRLAKQALVVCENRIHLLLLEAQEERERIFHAFWIAVSLAIFILLAGIAFTGLVVLLCWPWSPAGALALLVAVYGGMAGFFYLQLVRLRQDWQSFADTVNELRKDRECLEKNLH